MTVVTTDFLHCLTQINTQNLTYQFHVCVDSATVLLRWKEYQRTWGDRGQPGVRYPN